MHLECCIYMLCILQYFGCAVNQNKYNNVENSDIALLKILPH